MLQGSHDSLWEGYLDVNYENPKFFRAKTKDPSAKAVSLASRPVRAGHSSSCGKLPPMEQAARIKIDNWDHLCLATVRLKAFIIDDLDPFGHLSRELRKKLITK